MIRRKKTAHLTPENQAIAAQGMARETEMFRLWLLHDLTHEQLSKQFGINIHTIKRTAKINKWHARKLQFRDRVYTEMLDSLKDRMVDVLGMLETDIKILKGNRQGRKKSLELTKDERNYLLTFIRIAGNELKLSEGKPTAINAGEIKMRYILPEGAKSPFVIPPGPSVSVEYEKLEDKTAGLQDAEFEDIIESHLEGDK